MNTEIQMTKGRPSLMTDEGKMRLDYYDSVDHMTFAELMQRGEKAGTVEILAAIVHWDADAVEDRRMEGFMVLDRPHVEALHQFFGRWLAEQDAADKQKAWDDFDKDAERFGLEKA